MVIVQNKNGKWRVCIDFINLNNACLKDNYPLPKIDQLVNATDGFGRMSFLDAYLRYNQIRMNVSVTIHKTFITEREFFVIR